MSRGGLAIFRKKQLQLIGKPCKEDRNLTEYDTTASRDLAKFCYLLPCFTDQTLRESDQLGLHERALVASFSKIGKLSIDGCNLEENYPTASRDLAKFLCLLPCLTDLTLRKSDQPRLHDDFYHELALLASLSKIQNVRLEGRCLDYDNRIASRYLARFLCILPCLTDLTIKDSHEPPLWFPEDFYQEIAVHGPSSMNHFFNKKLHLGKRSEELKQMDLTQQFEYIRRLVHPTLSDITSHPASRAPKPLSSHQGSVLKQIKYPSFVTTPDLDVPSTNEISAQRGKVPKGIGENFREHDTSPTTVEIGGVSDVQLNTIAARVPRDKYHHLSDELGIEYNEASRILKQHGSDSKPAMRECLSVWKSKTGGSFTELNRILNSVHLGDKYHSEGIFDQTGGELHIPSPGLTLSIPPGALQEGSSETITLNVLTDIPTEITLRNDETLVTHGFQCLPSGLQFVSGKPVRLKIPHCANLIDPEKVQVVLYSMNHGGEAERIEQTTGTCLVTYSHVEISLEHFTKGAVAMTKDSCSWKDKLMSFMPYLPKNMPNSREMMLEFRMVNKPAQNSWRNVHEIREKAEYQPAKDDDDEMKVICEDMEVTCQLKDNDTLKENVSARFIDKNKHTVYFELDFNGKADDLPVKLQVIQSNLPVMDIKFRTRFLPSRGITETSLGQTVSASTRPSPSKSAAIPPQHPSSAVAVKPGTQLYSERQGYSSNSVRVGAANSSSVTRNTFICQQNNTNCSRKRKKKTNRKTDSNDEDEQTKEDKQRKSHGSKNVGQNGPRRKRKKKTNRQTQS